MHSRALHGTSSVSFHMIILFKQGPWNAVATYDYILSGAAH